MNLVWCLELALKAYMNTVKSCEKLKELGVPELLSAMAAGWNTKFIVESWSYDVLHARMHHIYRNYCGGFRWSVLLQRGVHVVRSVFLRVGKGLDMYYIY
ncbi:uncharacterized protein LOC114405635 [Glycine soja]|uniref:uncharacterized protein LOC114405635 n=1 Tax=Glycine soja TaxID=3848 RepID=UPI00103EDAEA|nr:uncharacterized protein LOC114405635 [Glycine soja]